MARTDIDGQTEDELFRVFDDASGIQRRVFRMLARGHYNELTVDELRHQVRSLAAAIEAVGERVSG